MRTLILSGRIVANAEIKLTKNGNQYLEFRVANNEFGDEEGQTYWFRVTSFNSNHINLAPHLTKGKSIEVIGDLKTRPYTSTVTNKIEVSHDIRACEIKFDNNFSSRQDNVAQPAVPATAPMVENAKKTTVTRNPSTKPIATSTSAPTPVAAPVSTSTDDGEDDLPF